jgi:(2Fe-2S) ferredoxin
MAAPTFRIVICRGPECGDRRGAEALGGVCEQSLANHGLRGVAELAWQSCFGHCSQGPNVLVRDMSTESAPQMKSVIGSGFATSPGPRGVTALYNLVDAARLDRIVTEHVGQRRVVRDFIERPQLAVRAKKDVGDSK